MVKNQKVNSMIAALPEPQSNNTQYRPSDTRWKWCWESMLGAAWSQVVVVLKLGLKYGLFLAGISSPLAACLFSLNVYGQLVRYRIDIRAGDESELKYCLANSDVSLLSLTNSSRLYHENSQHLKTPPSLMTNCSRRRMKDSSVRKRQK